MEKSENCRRTDCSFNGFTSAKVDTICKSLHKLHLPFGLLSFLVCPFSHLSNWWFLFLSEDLICRHNALNIFKIVRVVINYWLSFIINFHYHFGLRNAGIHFLNSRNLSTLNLFIYLQGYCYKYTYIYIFFLLPLVLYFNLYLIFIWTQVTSKFPFIFHSISMLG